MKRSLYFPFSEYEREIHSQPSSYLDWQHENAVYDNSGRACAVPYEKAEPYLKKSIDRMWYLIDAPGEYRHCDFSKFSDLELYFLLRECIELSIVVPWHNMKEEYKAMLLSYHPELAESIEELQTLDGKHWQKILQIKPEYSIYTPWHKFTGDNWQAVLSEHPEFAIHCDFSKFSAENWQELLKHQIQFQPLCPIELDEETKEEIAMLHPETKVISNSKNTQNRK